MKRFLLQILGKLIIVISPILWKCPGKFAFKLHQKLGDIIINWHHRYKLNLWDEKI